MGTNYYTRSPRCPTCGRGDEEIHIGKSSYGWRFLFATWEDGPKSFAEWQERLKGQRIEDEYGRQVSLAELIDLVEAKKNGRTQTDAYTFLDEEGNPFYCGEFS